jgi:hypothetical protein
VSKSARYDIAEILTRVRTCSIEAIVVRCVPQINFMEHKPPVYLFTSFRRGRCNPTGVACIYFSEDEETADAEYRSLWAGTEAENQPKLIFRANIRLSRVLDLGMSDVRESFGISDRDLFDPWRRIKDDTLLQAIGRSINEQTNIAAMRFQSNAARQYGFDGWNIAIFKETLRSPEKVTILGNTNVPLESWPASKEQSAC